MFGLRVLSLRLLLVKQFNSNLKKSSADLGFHLNKADIKVERYCKNQGVKLHYKWYTSKTQKLSSKESIIFLLQFKCDTNYSKWFIGSRLRYVISASNVYLSPISASNVYLFILPLKDSYLVSFCELIGFSTEANHNVEHVRL